MSGPTNILAKFLNCGSVKNNKNRVWAIKNPLFPRSGKQHDFVGFGLLSPDNNLLVSIVITIISTIELYE